MRNQSHKHVGEGFNGEPSIKHRSETKARLLAVEERRQTSAVGARFEVACRGGDEKAWGDPKSALHAFNVKLGELTSRMTRHSVSMCCCTPAIAPVTHFAVMSCFCNSCRTEFRHHSVILRHVAVANTAYIPGIGNVIQGPNFACAPDNLFFCCLQWQEYCKYVLGPEDYKEYVSGSRRGYTDAGAAAKAIKNRPTPAEAQAREELTRTLLLLAHASGYDGGRHMAWRDQRGVLLARPATLSALRVNAGQGMGIIMNDVLHIAPRRYAGL
jgi:hypothetical protein